MAMIAAVALHLFITVFWFVLRNKRVGRQHAAIEAAMVFLLPGAGFLSLLIWRIICRLRHLDSGNYEKIWEMQDAVSLGQLLSETDALSLGDLTFVNDDKARRRLFTTAIKQEVVDNSHFLREAVGDRDREISYYAVSLMTARSEKLAAHIEELEQKLKTATGKEETTLLREYAASLKKYLDGGYGDALQQRMHQSVLRSVLTRLSVKDPDEKAYRYLSIRMAIDLGDLDQAGQAIDVERRRDPEAEEPIYLSLQIAVLRQDKYAIQRAVRELENLPGKRSKKAEQAVRYWGGELT